MALRVVSAPAANSRLKNIWSSTGVRRGGSTSANSACTTSDSMSSVGRSRFSAISAVP
ncbi:hypothetical protein ACU686_08830 [Yinghuangia aomiensis]